METVWVYGRMEVNSVMSRTTCQFVLALLAGAIVWSAAPEAVAGFLSISPSSDARWAFSGMDAGSGPVGHGSVPAEDRWEGSSPEFAYGGSSGMTSPVSVGSGGGASSSVAAVVAPIQPTSGQLEIWMARQRDRFHPRFTKTRLFRPPRS